MVERYRGEKANVIFDIHRSVTRSAGSYIFFLLLQGLHPLTRVYPCLLSFTRSAGVNCSADYVCVILKPRGRCNRNAGEKTVLSPSAVRICEYRPAAGRISSPARDFVYKATALVLSEARDFSPVYVFGTKVPCPDRCVPRQIPSS